MRKPRNPYAEGTNEHRLFYVLWSLVSNVQQYAKWVEALHKRGIAVVADRPDDQPGEDGHIPGIGWAALAAAERTLEELEAPPQFRHLRAGARFRLDNGHGRSSDSLWIKAHGTDGLAVIIDSDSTPEDVGMVVRINEDAIVHPE